ncbi:Uncharacterised protein [Mycobacteroides abscessus subsp. abscessus]|nr:Uncharacterised protein [Mycobacteroides abscessus subsp. abscessus]
MKDSAAAAPARDWLKPRSVITISTVRVDSVGPPLVIR